MAESVLGTHIRKHTFICTLIFDITMKELKEVPIFLGRLKKIRNKNTSNEPRISWRLRKKKSIP